MSRNKLFAFFVCVDTIAGSIIAGVYTGITNTDPFQAVFTAAIGGLLGLGVGFFSLVAYFLFEQCQEPLKPIKTKHILPLEALESGCIAPPPSIIRSDSLSTKNSLTSNQLVEPNSQTAEPYISTSSKRKDSNSLKNY